tara:strand:- start:554 stop:1141 length:588 start_codon:yes stop_codon:yes gene_type:complete
MEAETLMTPAQAVQMRRRMVEQQAQTAHNEVAAAAQKHQGAMADLKQIEKRSPVIHPTRMKLAENERQDWIVNAELSHTIEDLSNPGYWAHMAAQLSPYDHIEVRAEDGAWIANLIVIQADRSWAKVMLVSKFDLLDREALPSSVEQHKVEWKGPQHRFAVIRLADMVAVRTGFQTKEDGRNWMREHEKVIASPQ